MQTNLPAIATSQLPAHLAGAIGKNLAVSTQALTGAASGALRLVANQGRFRIKDGGSEIVLPDLTLDTIVVGALPGYTKNFYAKAYVPGADNNDEPDCSSLLGDVPDADSKNKQCDNCATCPQNAWGSKLTPAGVEIKACSDYRRTAMIAADDPDVIYQANIPPASIKDWTKYVKELASRGVDVSMVITRLSLNEHQWVFNFAGFVDAEQYAAVQTLLGSPQVDVALGLVGRPARAVALPAPAKAAPVVQAPAPAPEPAVEAPAAPAKATKGFGKKAAAAQAAPAAQSPAQAKASTVAVSSGGLENLAAELGNLIGGAPDV